MNSISSTEELPSQVSKWGTKTSNTSYREYVAVMLGLWLCFKFGSISQAESLCFSELKTEERTWYTNQNGGSGSTSWKKKRKTNKSTLSLNFLLRVFKIDVITLQIETRWTLPTGLLPCPLATELSIIAQHAQTALPPLAKCSDSFQFSDNSEGFWSFIHLWRSKLQLLCSLIHCSSLITSQ